ncbi:PilZ domain-containing protein [Candidatus Omnitrophota bacterium]
MKHHNTDRNYGGQERRAFVRYLYRKPMHCSTVTSPKDHTFISNMISAVSKDISASGILFTIDKSEVPDPASIVILDLDYKTARACGELEKRALIVNNKLLGKVVRVTENGDKGKADVGVAFITKSDRLSEDIKKLI